MKTRILYQSCPLCQSEKVIPVLYSDCSKHPLYNEAIDPKMTWCRCEGCKHVFTDGYFTDEALKIVFSKTNENQKVGYDAERQRLVSAKMVERVLPHMQSGCWLDVGFGNASLLFTAHEYGFEPVGVDLRAENVNVLKKLGIEAYCRELARIDHYGRYQVISLADVLEHMPYPKEALDVCFKLLAPGGVIMISLPNIDSYIWKLLDLNKTNPYWGELEHYHNFGRVRLFDLLKECGFVPLTYGISDRYRACMEILAKKTEA